MCSYWEFSPASQSGMHWHTHHTVQYMVNMHLLYNYNLTSQV